MKILHLLDEPWDSGITAYAIQLAALQKKQGMSVQIGVRPGKKPEKLAQSLHLETVAVQNPFDVLSLLKNQDWTLINAHTGRTHTWAVLAKKILFAKTRHIPVIRTRGDARPVRSNPLNKWLYKNTQGVIASSQHIEQQFQQQFGFSENKMISIFPGIQLQKEVPPPSSKTIGILGRLDPVKGHSTLIEAARRVLEEFPDVQFQIAGKDAAITSDILKNQARQLGVEKSFHFLGFVPSSVEFMNSCSIGVIASLGSEEVSRACLEWMSVGRPVVSTLVGCLPELVDPEETGLLVPPQDSISLADGILELLRTPELISKWGQRARDVVRERYSEDVFYTKTKIFYEHCLKNLTLKNS